MAASRWGAAAALLAGLLAGSCVPKVPPGAVAWNPSATVLSPGTPPPKEVTGDGWLRVETDRDVRSQGSLSYDHPRRSYDLYDQAGKLLRGDVANQGGRNGEEPVTLALPPGRYVVASMYGTTYRRVQVQIASGATTVVSEEALSQAPAVFH
jgi:hypothetical protein